MSNLQKVFLSLSCFLPLFPILGAKNVIKLIQITKQVAFSKCDLLTNIFALIIWGLCSLFGIIALFIFKKLFLSEQNLSSEKVILRKAENITGEYYFTYFSFFVLTFFTVDPTQLIDVIVLVLIMVFIIIVYVKNDMLFINPVLNILGYKSFKITYKKNEIEQLIEINVFSKDNLCKEINSEYHITYSQHDFSVCYNKR